MQNKIHYTDGCPLRFEPGMRNTHNRAKVTCGICLKMSTYRRGKYRLAATHPEPKTQTEKE